MILAAVAPDDSYYLNIIMQAATYAIGVAGLVVVLGYCGQISLAQAGFLGMGAYVLALLTVRLGVPFAAATVAAALVCGASGLLLGFASLRLGGHYLAMVTISFQVILTLVLTNWIELTGGPDGISGIPRPALLTGPHAYLGLCLVILVCAVVLHMAAEAQPARPSHAGGARQRDRGRHLRHRCVPRQGRRIRHQRDAGRPGRRRCSPAPSPISARISSPSTKAW